jgi:hypothetical protein
MKLAMIWAFIRRRISAARDKAEDLMARKLVADFATRNAAKIKMGLRARSGDGFLAHKPIRS